VDPQEQCDEWKAGCTDQDADSDELNQTRHELDPRREAASGLSSTSSGWLVVSSRSSRDESDRWHRLGLDASYLAGDRVLEKGTSDNDYQPKGERAQDVYRRLGSFRIHSVAFRQSEKLVANGQFWYRLSDEWRLVRMVMQFCYRM
jgi:hypothetical protein